MKKIKYAIAIMFIVTIIASSFLTGCGALRNIASNAKNSMVGKYQAEYNAKDALNASMEDIGIVLNEDVPMIFQLDLKEDETFTFNVDAEKFTGSVTDAIKKNGPEIIKAMLQEEGIKEEGYEELAQVSGYKSFDDFVENVLNEMTNNMTEELKKTVDEEISETGSYEVKKNVISLIVSENEEADTVTEGTIEDDGSITIMEKIEGFDAVMELHFQKKK